MSAYLSERAVNWSTLKHLRRSPRHYLHALTSEREDTPRLALGRAAHTATLEPHRWADEYAVYPGARRAGKEWDAFEASAGERTILKATEADQAQRIAQAVHAHPRAHALLTGGKAEHVIKWDESGIPCKARLDYLGAAVVDLKTCGDASPREVGRTAASMGYHCQLAWYRRGVHAVTGQWLDAYIIAVEVAPPHDVGVYRVGAEALALANDIIDELLATLAECRTRETWPGACPDESELVLPAWVYAAEYGDDEELTATEIEGD